MKKNLLLLLGLVVYIPSFSQNWAPINTTEKFCYSTDDTLDIINNVLWVDSFEQNGTQQVFQLNKIARPVEGEDFQYLFNEPQFLLDQITIQENGEWECLDIFFTPLDTLETFSLFPNLGLNGSWNFTNELQAEITDMGLMDVLGETDSVKTITLSDNSEIILSKEHGIVNWRSQYQLVGIEGRDLGVLVPDFDDMYANISAGDVVCLHSGYWWADETVEGWSKETRMDIDQVAKYQDSIAISAYVTSNTSYYWKHAESLATKSYKNLVYYRDEYTEVYPNETITINVPTSDAVIISKLSVHQWGGMKKTQLVMPNEWGMNISALIPCESLYSYELCSDYSDELFLMEPSVNWGFTEFYEEGFEWGGHNELIGIIDNADTLGTIYPLEMFVGTNQLTTTSNWLVYPNPAKDQMYLHSSQTGMITYQIFNYSGILEEEQTINKTAEEISISTDGFSSGVYLIKLINNHQTEVLKFIKD